jgi:hypothetical protein
MKNAWMCLLVILLPFVVLSAARAQQANNCVSLTTRVDTGIQYYTVVNNCNYKLSLTWVSRDIVPTKRGYDYAGTQYIQANKSRNTFFAVQYGIHVYACQDPSWPSTLDDHAIFAPTSGYKCNR